MTANFNKYIQASKTSLLPSLLVVSLFFILAGLFMVGRLPYQSSWWQVRESDNSEDYETSITVLDGFFKKDTNVYDEINEKENLFSTLKRLEVSAPEAELFIAAFKDVINLRALVPHTVIRLQRSHKNVQWHELENTTSLANTLSLEALEIFLKDSSGVAYSIEGTLNELEGQKSVLVSINKPEVQKSYNIIAGEVSDSLYSSMIKSGGDPQLVNSFADVFAWQVDFYRETQLGDTYQLIVEQNISDGRNAGFGQILAAEYSKGSKTLRAYYFASADKSVSGFFDQDGKSLKNAFLKSPIKLASIGSKFGMRFHPIQKRLKPHNGVDYGAARGTPFMAIANGVVINAGYSRFNGNWVRIKHINGHETEYLHASRLAKGIRVGARVSQGQVIGYVGSTGMATGPHLHFGMKLHGKYVNPTGQKFAPSEGIAKRYLDEFKRKIQPMVIAFNSKMPPEGPILAQD